MKLLLTDVLMFIGERFSGPMNFRLLLQPLVATVLAVRAGLKDARENRPPYFSTLISDRSQRRGLLLEGWKSVAKVFVMAVIIDLVYQYLVDGSIRVLEALGIAAILAIVPYVLFRGPVNRLASRSRKDEGEG
jgi:hypothetical protein